MEKRPIRGLLYVCLGVMVLMLAGCNWPLAKHANTPGTPTYEDLVIDCNTGVLVEPGELIQPVPGCDSWQINRYERPFNAGTQDEYHPDLDILYAELGRDDTWFYLNLALYDPNEDTDQLDGTYGIEIDWDRDGRGDILVGVETPGKYAEDEWSVLGVQVWTDDNNDVGNAEPREPDLPYLGNGYDLLVFNQGDGDDPDAAWSRAFLHQSAYVEIAFKANLLQNPDEFIWWVWSDQGVVNPGGFDYHDTFSNEEAGDANDYMSYFPSNQVYELDNTCAALWGLLPDDDPNLCVNDINFALDRPVGGCLEMDAFLEDYYASHPGPPLPPDIEDTLYHKYLLLAGCEDITPTPTKPDSFTETPTGTLFTSTFTPTGTLFTSTATPTSTLLTRTITPTGTLLTPTETLRTPDYTTYTPTPPTETATVTPTATRDNPCDWDCYCEPDQGETANNCPNDCPNHCGNGSCDARCGENTCNCQKDCGDHCGDGICNCGENINTCQKDCR